MVDEVAVMTVHVVVRIVSGGREEGTTSGTDQVIGGRVRRVGPPSNGTSLWLTELTSCAFWLYTVGSFVVLILQSLRVYGCSLPQFQVERYHADVADMEVPLEEFRLSRV